MHSVSKFVPIHVLLLYSAFSARAFRSLIVLANLKTGGFRFVAFLLLLESVLHARRLSPLAVLGIWLTLSGSCDVVRLCEGEDLSSRVFEFELLEYHGCGMQRG